MYPVRSYCTDISHCTVNKALKKSMEVNKHKWKLFFIDIMPKCFSTNTVKWQELLEKKFINMGVIYIYFVNVTFRGPCIVIYFYNKSQRDVLFLKFILIKYSTCFGQIYCPSTGVSTLYTAIRICHVVQLTVC